MKTRAHYGRNRGRAWIVIVATVLTLGFGVRRAHAVVTSSLWVPVSGMVYDSFTGESVMLMGNLHTVVQVGMDANGMMMCAAHVNLPDTMGMGETSDMRYMANGAAQLPPSPCSPGTPFSFFVSLTLRPPSPNMNNVMPLLIMLRGVIGEDGHVMSIEAMFGRAGT